MLQGFLRFHYYYKNCSSNWRRLWGTALQASALWCLSSSEFRDSNKSNRWYFYSLQQAQQRGKERKHAGAHVIWSNLSSAWASCDFFGLQASIRSLIKLVALLGIDLVSLWPFSVCSTHPWAVEGHLDLVMDLLSSAMSWLHQATCRAQEFFAKKLAEFTYQVCQTTIQYLRYFHHNRFRQNKEKENQSNTEYFLVSFVHLIGSTRTKGKETHQSTCSAPRLHQASPRLRCEPSRPSP